jgi:L-rhamnose mutarotase
MTNSKRGAYLSMQQVAFQVHFSTGKIDDYGGAHQRVWGELLQKFERFGITEYSTLHPGQQFFLYMRVPVVERTLESFAASEVDQRWRAKMPPLFEPVPDLLYAGRSLHPTANAVQGGE